MAMATEALTRGERKAGEPDPRPRSRRRCRADALRQRRGTLRMPGRALRDEGEGGQQLAPGRRSRAYRVADATGRRTGRRTPAGTRISNTMTDTMPADPARRAMRDQRRSVLTFRRLAMWNGLPTYSGHPSRAPVPAVHEYEGTCPEP